MKVLIVPNYAREDAIESARRLERWLDEEGVDVAWAHDKRLLPDATSTPSSSSQRSSRRALSIASSRA